MHQIAIAQWAHDIRNALATVALYVETLELPLDVVAPVRAPRQAPVLLIA